MEYSPVFKGKTIVIDARFLDPKKAGISRYTRELIKGITRIKTGAKWIVIVKNGEKFEDDFKDALDKSKDTIELIGTDIGHYTLSEQREFLKLLNNLKPDLIHFTNFNHPVRLKRPFVTTIHDLIMSKNPTSNRSRVRNFAYNYVMRNAVKRSKLILTVSNYSKRDIVTEYKIVPDKVMVTYNGIDTHRFRPISNPTRLNAVLAKYKIDKPYILNVGQWMKHKNLYALVDAMERLNAELKYKGKYQLVIAGRPREYDAMVEYIKAKNLESVVLLPGFVDETDLPILYNAARLFAFPSLAEGFGIPPLEAMACGTPVVSSNATCMPEVLGDAALYFDPRNVKNITEVIIAGLTNTSLRDKCIKKGLTQASRYRWQETVDGTLKAYEKVLTRLK